MDEMLLELESMTFQMVERLHAASFEELEHFVGQRGQIIDQLKQFQLNPNQLQQYKLRMQRVLEYDQQVMAKLEEFRVSMKAELSKFKDAKTQKSAYYAGYTPESAFIDKKN